jgi:hypothetical protein
MGDRILFSVSCLLLFALFQAADADLGGAE